MLLLKHGASGYIINIISSFDFILFLNLWYRSHQIHLSHEKNPALLSIESWMVNRDPYNGLL